MVTPVVFLTFILLAAAVVGFTFVDVWWGRLVLGVATCGLLLVELRERAT